MIHNVPDFLLTTTHSYDETLELDELIFNSHVKKDLTSRKPSISKVYLNNITVISGRSVHLKCPSVFDPSLTNDVNTNDETKINEYLQIKTTIWSHELEFPKLLSNDKYMFVQNKRYSLKNSMIFNSSHLNDQLVQLFGKPKYFDLFIDPVERSDAGWYSCYVVKRNVEDQNIKYFTYVNVIEDLKSLTKEPMNSSVQEDKNLNNYVNKVITKKYVQDHARAPSMNIPLSSYTDIKFQIDQTKTHSYFVSTGIFDREKQEVITVPFNDETKADANLKRQIANVSIKAINSKGVNKDEEIKPTVLVKSKATSQTPYPLIKNRDVTTTFSTLNQHVEESLSVYPEELNTTDGSSFQLDCIYKGHQYLKVNLRWYRNGYAFQLHREPKRIINLDYKQNYTRFSILKFSKGFSRDTGRYKCVAYNEKEQRISHSMLVLMVNESKLILF